MNSCPRCSFRNTDGASFCIRCGTRLLSAEERFLTRKAVAGFVLALFGLVTMVTLPMQIAALVLCLSARKTPTRRGLAVAGIVLSVIGILFSVLFITAVASDPTILSEFSY